MGCVGRARVTAIALALACQAGCGIAERAGRGASQGAIAQLAEKARDREGMKDLAEGISRRAARGMVSELSRAESTGDIERIAAALAAGTVSGASRALGAPAQTGHGAALGAGIGRRETPVEALAAQAARAFSRQMAAELGQTGGGPLGASLSATAGEVSGAMARGAGSELGALFPECRGERGSGCLELAVERLSRASAAGIAAGARASLGPWPYVLAFAAGALLALLVAWAIAVLSRLRKRRQPGDAAGVAFDADGAHEAPRSTISGGTSSRRWFRRSTRRARDPAHRTRRRSPARRRRRSPRRP